MAYFFVQISKNIVKLITMTSIAKKENDNEKILG